MYDVVAATAAHADYLASHMREADAAEVWASGHHTPAEALHLSMKVSREPMTGTVDGQPVCMFGLVAVTALSDFGVPWLLGSEELPRHARVFLRANKLLVGHWRSQYAILENYVDARNKVAIRWLSWLGFTVFPAQPFGPEQLPFHKFGAYQCASQPL